MEDKSVKTDPEAPAWQVFLNKCMPLEVQKRIKRAIISSFTAEDFDRLAEGLASAIQRAKHRGLYS